MPQQIVPASTTVKLIPNAFKPEGCPNGTGYGYACAYNYNGWYDQVAKKHYADQGYFTGTGIPNVTLHADWSPRGAKAADSHNYATTSLNWDSFIKLLQVLR